MRLMPSFQLAFITPARLELITAVGPPDCPIIKLPFIFYPFLFGLCTAVLKAVTDLLLLDISICLQIKNPLNYMLIHFFSQCRTPCFFRFFGIFHKRTAKKLGRDSIGTVPRSCFLNCQPQSSIGYVPSALSAANFATTPGLSSL